jgi:hypothetical protein
MRGVTPLLLLQLPWRVQGLHFHYGLISYRTVTNNADYMTTMFITNMKGEGGAFYVQEVENAFVKVESPAIPTFNSRE